MSDKKRVLVTGINGFVGGYLTKELQKQDITLYGIGRSPYSDSSFSYTALDLLEYQKLYEYLLETKPDEIYHLASFASAKKSLDDPALFLTNNSLVTLNLLEAIHAIPDYSPRILLVTSADIYGLVSPENLPIDETVPFRPINPYAVSKITQDCLGLQYFLSYKLDIIRVRPFNHIGPNQSEDFAVSHFAKQIAQIENGISSSLDLQVGNLKAKRDFTDVRDVVKAYVLLMEKGKKGEAYNLGSGESISLEDILSLLLSHSSKPISISQDPSLLRPLDIPELVCDYTKLKKDTGWIPTIPLSQTIKDILDYWKRVL